MNILLNWLSDYVETKLAAEQIAEILSDVGLPYEGIKRIGGDSVIDVEVTSNRGDCLSHIGVARELAAATGGELKIPVVELDESAKDVTGFAFVEIAEPELCGRYTARVIEGVKVGPSPNWLRKRLEAVGVRSVNNVVDATNYAMMETGQPPHAFDYDKIAEGRIIVRKALAGETIVSIDGTRCELEPEMLIIADAQGPVAIAGVMGGLDTEVSEATTRILLEDAYFDPVSVRTTSRRLSLPSESAFRFERTVDIEMVDRASRRTAQLITQAAGGKVAKGVVDIYPKRPPKKEVVLRLSRLNKLLGIEVGPDEAVGILSRLSFEPQRKDDCVVCSVPSWRSDVYREADLIEEVARVYGYNKIPAEKKIEIEVVPVDSRQKLAQSIGAYLNACGFYETINVTFIDDSVAKLFVESDDERHLEVKDVTGRSINLLRRSLIGSLLAVLKTNLNAKNSPCRIFEISDTFVPKGKQGELPIERARLAIVCDGELRGLRGVVEGLVKSINKGAEAAFMPCELCWAETGAEIMVGGNRIGVAGMVCQAVKDKFGFKEVTACGAELDFEQLLALQSGEFEVKPIPRFPAIERDLSLIVDESVAWVDISRAVNKKAPAELEEVRFVGIYRGEGIGSGKKSVTLSLRFRDEEGTLRHEAVDGFEKAIVGSVAKKLGAKLRTI